MVFTWTPKNYKYLSKGCQKKNFKQIFDFFPHPRMILKKYKIKLIDTLRKRSNLRKLGIDNLIIHPFSLNFQN